MAWLFAYEKPQRWLLLGLTSSSAPHAFNLQEPTILGGIQQKESIYTRGGCTPPSPFASHILHLKLDATLLGTLPKSPPNKHHNPGQIKCNISISRHTSSQCVYLTSALVLMSMKDVYQTDRKLTFMVHSTNCKFLEHDVPDQLLLISSQRNEPSLLPGE